MSLLLSLAAAVSTSAFAADAQATFKLPQSVRIGSGVLPAGVYKVSMAADGTTKAFVSPVDTAAAGMVVLPVTVDDHATCSTSQLSLQRVGSEWNVRSVCFAGSQVALYFPVTAEKSSMSAAVIDNATLVNAAK